MAKPPMRGRFKFSISTLILLTTAAAFAVGWWREARDHDRIAGELFGLKRQYELLDVSNRQLQLLAALDAPSIRHSLSAAR